MSQLAYTNLVDGDKPTASGFNTRYLLAINLLNSGVETDNIAALAVTTAKIANNAVDGTKIAMGSDAQGDILYYDGTNYVRLAPGISGQVLETQGAAANPQWTSASSAPKGFINGLNMTNAADADHDITIAVGECRNDDDDALVSLSATLTKQIDAVFAEGDAAGGLFGGAPANNTTYYVIMITKDADGTVDAYFDTDIDGSNAPSGWTQERHIGTVITDGSANILEFTQVGNGNDREYFTAGTDLIDTTVTATSYTDLDCSNAIPPSSVGKFVAHLDGSAGPWFFKEKGFTADMIVTDDPGASAIFGFTFNVTSDSSSVIQYKHTSGSSRSLKVRCYGFKETV